MMVFPNNMTNPMGSFSSWHWDCLDQIKCVKETFSNSPLMVQEAHPKKIKLLPRASIDAHALWCMLLGFHKGIGRQLTFIFVGTIH
jgi:hypothetical protein